MKTRHFLIFGLGFLCLVAQAAQAAAKTATKSPAPRIIQLHVEKLADGTHWMPKEVEVKKGETVVFELTDKLEGMPLHGFTIEKLGISDMVELNKTKKLPAKKIDLEPGNYDITCQFHPTHKQATLVVKPADEAPAKAATEKKS